MLLYHYKQSHSGIDRCPIVMNNEEIESMKSYKYKNETNNSRQLKIKRLELNTLQNTNSKKSLKNCEILLV